MQAIALGLAFTLTLIQTPSGQRKSAREQAGLVGNVRSVLTEIASLEEKDGKLVERRRFGTTVTRYDEKGFKTERVQYAEDKIIWRDLFTYDAEGNYTQKIYIALRAGSDDSPEVFKVQVKYDSEGNPIEEAIYGTDGNLRGKRLYKYDRQANKTEETETNADGSVRRVCLETLGERGLPVESACQYFDNQSIVKSKFTYEFDSTGNWTKRHQTGTQTQGGKQTQLGKDIVYQTISYDAAKDVYTDDRSRMVDPLPDRPMVIRLSGGVLQKKATRRTAPKYPTDARAAGVTGSVVVEVRVDVNGKVIKAEAVSGPDELRQAAVDAARQWEFTPTKMSGQPIDVIGTLTFVFTR
jgi:TonB family protein